MSLRAAVAFLTPVGGSRSPSPAALVWFPVVGASLGAGLGGLWWVLERAWPAPVAAAVVVAADLALTGLLHIDGLIDSGDGLMPHLDRMRRLEVMAEPQVGAFGVAFAIAAVALRITALASTVPDVWILAGLWCLSRTVMAGVVRWQPYARPGGLASVFAGGRGGRLTASVVAGCAAGFAMLLVWRPLGGAVTAIAALVAAAAVVALARRRLGGYTGDVLGAAGYLAESVGLVVASARW